MCKAKNINKPRPRPHVIDAEVQGPCACPTVRNPIFKAIGKDSECWVKTSFLEPFILNGDWLFTIKLVPGMKHLFHIFHKNPFKFRTNIHKVNHRSKALPCGALRVKETLRVRILCAQRTARVSKDQTFHLSGAALTECGKKGPHNSNNCPNFKNHVTQHSFESRSYWNINHFSSNEVRPSSTLQLTHVRIDNLDLRKSLLQVLQLPRDVFAEELHMELQGNKLSSLSKVFLKHVWNVNYSRDNFGRIAWKPAAAGLAALHWWLRWPSLTLLALCKGYQLQCSSIPLFQTYVSYSAETQSEAETEQGRRKHSPPMNQPTKNKYWKSKR